MSSKSLRKNKRKKTAVLFVLLVGNAEKIYSSLYILSLTTKFQSLLLFLFNWSLLFLSGHCNMWTGENWAAVTWWKIAIIISSIFGCRCPLRRLSTKKIRHEHSYESRADQMHTTYCGVHLYAYCKADRSRHHPSKWNLSRHFLSKALNMELYPKAMSRWMRFSSRSCAFVLGLITFHINLIPSLCVHQESQRLLCTLISSRKRLDFV